MKKPPVKLKAGFVMPGFMGWVPLPRLIIFNPKYQVTRRFVAHELMHVIQWERYGITFIPRYLYQWMSVGFSYTNIPMEKEARAVESNAAFLEWADEVIRSQL
jgi:hypothetical protein